MNTNDNTNTMTNASNKRIHHIRLYSSILYFFICIPNVTNSKQH